MKTFRFAALALCAALAVISCQEKEPKEKDTTPAELLSFKLLKADNSGFEEDIVADPISENMVLRVKGGGVGKTLVATLEAGENDKIMVNDEAVSADGKASFDATFPVDVVVTNSKSGLKASYVVKIGKILEIVAKQLPTYMEAEDATHALSAFVAANPADGKAYIAYERQLMVNGTKESYKNVSVVRWNGSAYELVGKSGICDNSKRSTNIAGFDFDADGNGYIVHYGELTANVPGVKKFDGTSWSILGQQEFNDKINTSFGEATIYSDNGHPAFIVMDRTTTYLAGKFYFDGTNWTCTTNLPDAPVYDAAAKVDQYWRSVSLTDGDKTYIVSGFNQHGLYMHSVKNNTFTTLVKEFKPEGQEYVLPNMTLRKGTDGKLYLLASVLQPAAMQIFRYDEEAKEFKVFSDPISGYTIGGSLNTIQQPTTFFILPTGQFVVVRINNDALPEYCVLDENRQWSEWKIAGSKKQYSQYSAAMTKGGEILMAYISRDDTEKIARIESVLLKLEDDVLPE
ncbi:MAG: hypothetical protein IJM35_04070 [Bacteroidales bacterium]|nr:hypothetical protein [Bacteroidales bacterium]